MTATRFTGSALVMSTIYFGDEVPEPVTMSVANQISDSGLATAIPMHVEFRARARVRPGLGMLQRLDSLAIHGEIMPQ